MVCCLLLAGVLGLLLWPARHLFRHRKSALDWRAGGHATDQPSPAANFSLAARARSMAHAWNGLSHAIRTQHNVWIHIGATLLVIAAGIVLELKTHDWRWLALAVAWVWFAELANTALEHLCDVVSPEFNLSVKRAKDIAAGSVMVSSLAAAAIGALTFAPYMMRIRAPW